MSLDTESTTENLQEEEPMKSRFAFLTFAAMAVILAQPANASVVNFDDVPDGTAIDNTYSALGVNFINPLGNADIFARTYASRDPLFRRAVGLGIFERWRKPSGSTGGK
jgi:hypothetical protein